MNVFALSVVILVILTALAAVGVAAWTWHTVATIGDELRDFAGFDVIHLEEGPKPSSHLS